MSPQRPLWLYISMAAVMFTVGALVGIIASNIRRPDRRPPFIRHNAENKEMPANTASTRDSIKIQPDSPSIHPAIATSSSAPSRYAISATEGRFLSTIKSCLGKYCQEFEVGNPGVNRVGILAPPGSGGMEVANALTELFSKFSLGRKSFSPIEFVYTAHVPAYGYGRNHGWTKIIRLVRPVLDHAALLVDTHDTDAALMALQTRQLARWHCRLSHVAAHTKMLSVFVEDILARPAAELFKLASFSAGGNGIPTGAIPRSAAALASALSAPTVALSVHRGGTHGTPTAREASEAALAEEFDQSNGFQRWPCKTFNDLLSDSKSRQLPIKPISLAPACRNKYVKCSVNVDKRESKGEGNR